MAVESEDNSEHQDSQLISRKWISVGMLGVRLKICRDVGCVGIGCCDIAQASGRRSRLDSERLIEIGICNETVTSTNVANPLQIANARRGVKLEDGLVPTKCIQVHDYLSSPSIVVVNEDRFALND